MNSSTFDLAMPHKRIARLFILIFLLCLSSAVRSQTVGLVLSGGGVRGMAHLGVIKALEEEGIPIDFITGTSAGALVGSMYASGLTPDQMITQLSSPDFIRRAGGGFNEENGYLLHRPEPDASIASVRLLLDSILRTQIPSNVVNTGEIDFSLMESFALPSAISNYDFDSLLVPFRCVSADITAKTPVVFSNGDLALAVRASMAFPFYFPPVIIENNLHYDGGIYNNFPADVMMESFHPDLVIGVNVVGSPEPPAHGNFLSQLKSMIQQHQELELPRSRDIMITPDLSDISTLEFEDTQRSIDSGYAAAKRLIPLLRASISRKTDPDALSKGRNRLRSTHRTITIEKIRINGLNQEQSAYIQSVLNPKNKCLTLSELRQHWFRLLADENLAYLYPKLLYNSTSGDFHLLVDARRKQGLAIDFGGIVSSRPINTGFVSMQQRFMGQQSMLIHGNLYFGKLYNSASLRLRLDIPGSLPFYVEPAASISQFDYFKSSSTFFSDVKPSFLIQQERLFSMTVGMPIKQKTKLTTSIHAFRRNDRYYLTRNFTENDTADITRMDGFMGMLQFERNTLNRKMYPNEGVMFRISGRGIIGDEFTAPGNTRQFVDTTKIAREWLQMGIQYEQYWKTGGWYTPGFQMSMQFSGMPFLSNFRASTSFSNAFQPLPEMQSVFLDAFRANSFVGIGTMNIFSVSEDIDFRLEGYVFQPFQEILEKTNFKTYAGEAFNKRYFCATANAVYSSPVGPISLALNYIQGREEPLSVMFHLGYLIFNRRIFQ